MFVTLRYVARAGYVPAGRPPGGVDEVVQRARASVRLGRCGCANRRDCRSCVVGSGLKSLNLAHCWLLHVCRVATIVSSRRRVALLGMSAMVAITIPTSLSVDAFFNPELAILLSPNKARYGVYIPNAREQSYMTVWVANRQIHKVSWLTWYGPASD